MDLRLSPVAPVILSGTYGAVPRGPCD